jgi:uncharacterized protein
MNSTRDFKFYVKDIQPKTGTFQGLGAVYGNVDLGGDIIEPGAFTRTIKNSGGKVPLLWQHDQHEPIGIAKLSDSKEGLVVNGQLVMESNVAQKAFALMKADVLTGLSIGFDTVVSEYNKEKDIRHLKELKLWEMSLVTFPMNTSARVTAVKSRLSDFASMVKAQIAEVKRGVVLTEDSREGFLRLQDQISALLETDPDPDSVKALATQGISDSELHSLLNSIKEQVQ